MPTKTKKKYDKIYDAQNKANQNVRMYISRINRTCIAQPFLTMRYRILFDKSINDIYN